MYFGALTINFLNPIDKFLVGIGPTPQPCFGWSDPHTFLVFNLHITRPYSVAFGALTSNFLNPYDIYLVCIVAQPPTLFRLVRPTNLLRFPVCICLCVLCLMSNWVGHLQVAQGPCVAFLRGPLFSTWASEKSCQMQFSVAFGVSCCIAALTS